MAATVRYAAGFYLFERDGVEIGNTGDACVRTALAVLGPCRQPVQGWAPVVARYLGPDMVAALDALWAAEAAARDAFKARMAEQRRQALHSR
jgi:hypothetical protein